jgi:hypothetical protein
LKIVLSHKHTHTHTPTSAAKKQTEIFLKQLREAKKTFQESHRSDLLQVYHKLDSDSLSVVFEGELDGDISTCVAFAREWDLVKDWNGFVIKSEVLRMVSILEMVVSSEVWMPWPFKNRNMCIRTVGYDVTSDLGCFFIRLQPEDPRLSDPDEQLATIYCNGGVVLKPVSPTKTKAIVMVTVRENRMKLVPNWLLSAILRVYTPRTFATMNQLVRIAKTIQQKNGSLKDYSDQDLKVCQAVVDRIHKAPTLYKDFLSVRADNLLLAGVGRTKDDEDGTSAMNNTEK